jgi:predicted glutamine amidotransferase
MGKWLGAFRKRGGDTADNPDGWGVARWQGQSAVIEESPEPGFRSPRLGKLAESLTSALLIAHVRKATYPAAPGYLNTHPFVHDCCGREWVFAHNGMVPEVIERPCLFGSCHPEGQTDSEFAFCHLLAGIVDSYGSENPDEWLSRLAESAGTISTLGKFNFLLSDGEMLIAHGHDRLHHDERPEDCVVIATEPLDDGDWQAFAPGELRVYRHGQLLARHPGQTDDSRRL